MLIIKILIISQLIGGIVELNDSVERRNKIKFWVGMIFLAMEFYAIKVLFF